MTFILIYSMSLVAAFIKYFHCYMEVILVRLEMH